MFNPKPLIRNDNLSVGLQQKPDNLDPEEHLRIVKRICKMFKKAKYDESKIDAPYRLEGEWSSYINERRSIYDKMLDEDIPGVADKLRNFWRNELGPIVKEYALFNDLVDNKTASVDRFQTNIVRNYQIWKDIFALPTKSLEVQHIGNPWGYMIDGTLVVPKATRYHAHATQIGNLLKGIRHPIIGEIGAGYGGTAYYLLKDENTLTYIDFDLPETLVISAYYLLCSYTDRKFYLYGEGKQPTGKELKKYSALFLPQFTLPYIADKSIDLILNAFSLSEMTWEILTEYIEQIQRTVKFYLLHNNVDRSGVINRGFERIPASAYPVDQNILKLVYKHYDLFHGHNGDYKEFLFERI